MGEGQDKNENMNMNLVSHAISKTPKFYKETLKVIENYHPMMNNKQFGDQILFPVSSIDTSSLFTNKSMISYAYQTNKYISTSLSPLISTTTKIVRKTK